MRGDWIINMLYFSSAARPAPSECAETDPSPVAETSPFALRAIVCARADRANDAEEAAGDAGLPADPAEAAAATSATEPTATTAKATAKPTASGKKRPQTECIFVNSEHIFSLTAHNNSPSDALDGRGVATPAEKEATHTHVVPAATTAAAAASSHQSQSRSSLSNGVWDTSTGVAAKKTPAVAVTRANNCGFPTEVSLSERYVEKM